MMKLLAVLLASAIIFSGIGEVAAQWEKPIARIYPAMMENPLVPLATTVIQGCLFGCYFGVLGCLCASLAGPFWCCLAPFTSSIGGLIGSLLGATIEMTLCVPMGRFFYKVLTFSMPITFFLISCIVAPNIICTLVTLLAMSLLFLAVPVIAGIIVALCWLCSFTLAACLALVPCLGFLVSFLWASCALISCLGTLGGTLTTYGVYMILPALDLIWLMLMSVPGLISAAFPFVPCIGPFTWCIFSLLLVCPTVCLAGIGDLFMIFAVVAVFCISIPLFPCSIPHLFFFTLASFASAMLLTCWAVFYVVWLPFALGADVFPCLIPVGGDVCFLLIAVLVTDLAFVEGFIGLPLLAVVAFIFGVLGLIFALFVNWFGIVFVPCLLFVCSAVCC